MAIQDKIRTKLSAKVFGKIGKTATLKTVTPVYDNRGDMVDYSSVDTQITFVPYNITTDETLYEQWGNVNIGEMDAAIPYDTIITIDDRMTIESEDWQIINIQKNYLPDNVVTIVRLSKIL